MTEKFYFKGRTLLSLSFLSLGLLFYGSASSFGSPPVEKEEIDRVQQATPEPTQVPGSETECPTDLRLEAENGTLYGDMVVQSLDNDPDVKFVTAVPEAPPAFYTEFGSREHRVDICVNIVDRGIYTLAAWGLAYSGDQNSFYITVDRDPESLSQTNERWDITELADPEDVIGPIFLRYDITYFDETEPRRIFLAEGEHIISFRARESGAMVDRIRLDLIEALPNQIPVILNVQDRYNVLDDAIDFQITVVDYDQDDLTLSAENLPAGVVIHPLTGVISGSPVETGEFEVIIRAEDSSGGISTRSFTWTIFESSAQLPTYTTFTFLPFIWTE